MSSTSAEMVAQRLTNVVLVGIGISRKQGSGGNDHAVKAISALSGGLIDKGCLYRMQLFRRCQTFQRGDATRADRTKRHSAGPDCTAIDQDRAGAAFPEPATIFRSIETKIVSKNVK
jgi:hypothetical protein